MELVAVALFFASAWIRSQYLHIDSQANRLQAQHEYQRQRQFVRDTVSAMDREAAMREHVSAISRDWALGGETTYEGDRAMVARMMREVQESRV